jgi:hypothetical protein
MGSTYGHKIITDSLIQYLDVGNIKSFKGGRTLINWNTWLAGAGSVTGYTCNGADAKTSRSLQTDPFGNSNMIWGTVPDGTNTSDGGYSTSYFTIDKTKLYRFSVWVQRTSATGGGTCYFGLHTNGTGDTYHLSDGASQTNPYWHYPATSALTQNTWYLFVGHIYPYNTTRTTHHPDSGVYIIAGGKVAENSGNVLNDVKFPSDATTMMGRTWHYYCNDATTRLQMFQPRVDLIDGHEPTISDILLNNVGSTLFDLTRNSRNLLIVKNPVINTERSLTLNGSDQGLSYSSTIPYSTCTVCMVYKTSETGELWVEGQTNAYYLSASDNNSYYHGNAGTPTNYVDLNTITNPYASGYKNNAYHYWEAKNVNFSTWTRFDWGLYPGGWQLAGTVAIIMVYNKALSAAESLQNYRSLKNRFGF